MLGSGREQLEKLRNSSEIFDKILEFIKNDEANELNTISRNQTMTFYKGT